jgi:hypothetical protein
MRLSEVIRKSIELGRLQGFVTFNQLNELAPPTTITTSEDIDTPQRAQGINIVEDD